MHKAIGKDTKTYQEKFRDNMQMIVTYQNKKMYQLSFS